MKPMFLLLSTLLASVSDPVAGIRMKPFSEFNAKYSGGIGCSSIHAGPCIGTMKCSVKVPLDSVGYL